MRSRRRLAGAAGLVLTLLCTSGLRAEVSAEVDAFSKYVRTVVLSNASAKSTKIWSAQRSHLHRVPLNIGGDQNGDLWPAIVEIPYDPKHAWVVWSRFNGSEYDLAWSRWGEGGWDPIRWLDPEPPFQAGDDLDPSLTLDSAGRPHVAWWRDEEGTGRVYLSWYLSTQWMMAFPVSDLGVDSRRPTIEVLADGKIRVTYETPEGSVAKIVFFTGESTITDDINPFNSLSVTNDPGTLERSH